MADYETRIANLESAIRQKEEALATVNDEIGVILVGLPHPTVNIRVIFRSLHHETYAHFLKNCPDHTRSPLYIQAKNEAESQRERNEIWKRNNRELQQKTAEKKRLVTALRNDRNGLNVLKDVLAESQNAVIDLTDQEEQPAVTELDYRPSSPMYSPPTFVPASRRINFDQEEVPTPRRPSSSSLASITPEPKRIRMAVTDREAKTGEECCCLCSNNLACILLEGCEHQVMCFGCLNTLMEGHEPWSKKCPVCRQYIDKITVNLTG
jgi:hypothetical protein